MKHVVALAALASGLIIVCTCTTSGNIVWQRRYDSGQEDFGRAVATDGNDVIVGGYWRDTTGEEIVIDWQILRYDDRGNLVWRRNYDSGNDDWLSDVMVDADHNIVATGFASLDSMDPAQPDSDVTTRAIQLLLVKFSAAGDVMWDRQYSFGLVTQGLALCSGPNGDIMVCGSVFAGPDSMTDDVLLAEFNSQDGSLVRAETLDFGADETGQDIVRDRDGNYVLVGQQVPLVQDSDSVSTGDLLIIKLDSAGKPRWRRIYDSGEDDLLGTLAVDSANNIHATVTFRQDGVTSMHVVEYTPEGQITEDRPYADQRNAACTSIVGDGKDALIGVGAAGPDDAQHYIAFRYRKGWFTNLLDPRNYHHGANDLAYAVALDSSKDIVVTGTSDPGTDPDILTIKLRNPNQEGKEAVGTSR